MMAHLEPPSLPPALQKVKISELARRLEAEFPTDSVIQIMQRVNRIIADKVGESGTQNEFDHAGKPCSATLDTPQPILHTPLQSGVLKIAGAR